MELTGKYTRRFQAFLRENRGILILMGLLLFLRLLVLFQLKFDFTIKSDDAAYIRSGIVFARTGTVTMHNDYPSAQSMPGMTWLIGIAALIFGEGKYLFVALKLLWILMGTATAWFLYRSVTLFAPKWCGLAAASCLFGVEYILIDNLILSETPTSFFLTAAIYCTLQMGKSGKKRYFIGCTAAYMAGFLIKANFGIYPLFAAVYLLCVKYSWKRLLVQGLILAGVMLCFLIPWTVRNYMVFHDFIPLTYGAGNPDLLGTYQGVGYPEDDELDYDTNVTDIIRKEYAAYYGEDGKPLPQYKKYVELRRDSLKANYRRQEWAKRDVKSLIYSTLVIKPNILIDGFYYPCAIFEKSADMVHLLQQLNTVLCVCAAAASLYLKKYRPQVGFLLFTYLGNVFIYACTFAYGRYNISLMCVRMILLGLGASLLIDLLRRALKNPA